MSQEYFVRRFKDDCIPHSRKYDMTPRFTPFGNHTLIGVGHSASISECAKYDQKALNSFYKTISQAQTLIMEGSRSNMFNMLQEYGTFEQTALQRFSRMHSPDHMHFLEDNYDDSEAGRKHGFDPHDFLVIITFGDIYVTGGVEKLRRLTPETIAKGAHNFLKANAGYQYLNTSKLANIMTILRENLIRLPAEFLGKNDNNLFINAWNICVWYHAIVRDIETITPEWKKVTDSSKGKTATVIGDLHVPSLSLVAKGKEIPPLPDWHDFVNMLGENHQEAVLLTERILHEKVD